MSVWLGRGGTMRMIYAGQLTCIGVQRVVLSMESTLSFLRLSVGPRGACRKLRACWLGEALTFVFIPPWNAPQ